MWIAYKVYVIFGHYYLLGTSKIQTITNILIHKNVCIYVILVYT